jgi:O-antigen/teichoic acid export membrane protein
MRKSIISHFISKVVASVAGFVATFAIARFLGPEVLGVYALIQSVIVWTSVPSWGVSKAAEKYISEGDRRRSHVSTAIILSAVSVIVISVLLLVFDGYVSQYVGADVTLLIVLLVVTTVSFDTTGAFMKGEKLVARFGWLVTVEKLLRTVFQLLLIFLGFAISGLLVGHAAALSIVVLAALYFIDIRPTVPTLDNIKQFLGFVRFSWMGGFRSKTFGWMDTFVLGIFVSSSLIGVYEVAWTLSAFLVLASDSIRSVIFPELSDLSGRDERTEIVQILSSGIQYTGIIIIPGFFGALVVGPRVLKIYSPEFVRGSTVLLLLILAQILEVYGSQFVDVLDAVDRPDLSFRTNVTFTIANFGLNIALVLFIGWIGAAVATLLSSLLTLLLGYHYLRQSLGPIPIPLSEIGKQVVCGGVMAIVVYGFDAVAPPNHYVTLLLVGAGAAIYGLCLIVVSADSRERAISLFEQVTGYQ